MSPTNWILIVFLCIITPVWVSISTIFREPPKPSILQQASSASVVFACPGLPFSHQFWIIISCFFCHRAEKFLLQSFSYFCKICTIMMDFGTPSATRWIRNGTQNHPSGFKKRPKSIRQNHFFGFQILGSFLG